MIARLICRLIGHDVYRSPVAWWVDDKGIHHVECGCCGARVERSLAGGLLVWRMRSGDAMPRGYGIAWVRWQDPTAVCMPIPLNIAAGWLRRAWLWCKWCHVRQNADPRQAYDEGYRQALQDAREAQL